MEILNHITSYQDFEIEHQHFEIKCSKFEIKKTSQLNGKMYRGPITFSRLNVKLLSLNVHISR